MSRTVCIITSEIALKRNTSRRLHHRSSRPLHSVRYSRARYSHGYSRTPRDPQAVSN